MVETSNKQIETLKQGQTGGGGVLKNKLNLFCV